MKIFKHISLDRNMNAIVLNYSTMQTSQKQRSVAIIWLIICGLFIGFVNGFWGGGGGMICVPVLTNLLGLPTKKGHATTILIMLPLSIASVIVYLLKGSLNWTLALNIGVGFVIGGIIGAMLLKKINNITLKLVFSVVIIIGGVKMLL